MDACSREQPGIDVIIIVMDHELPLASDSSLQPVNLHTRRAHRKEVFLQIWLPLLVLVLGLGTLVVLLIGSGVGSVEGTAQVATILLALVLGGLGLILLMLTVFMIAAAIVAMRWLPPHSYHTQVLVKRLDRTLIHGADRLVAPLVLVDSWASALKQVFERRV